MDYLHTTLIIYWVTIALFIIVLVSGVCYGASQYFVSFHMRRDLSLRIEGHTENIHNPDPVYEVPKNINGEYIPMSNPSAHVLL